MKIYRYSMKAFINQFMAMDNNKAHLFFFFLSYCDDKEKGRGEVVGE